MPDFANERNVTDSTRPNQTTAMAAQEPPKTCRVITAETISKGLLTEVKETLAKIQGDATKQPTLAAFLANDDPAASMYAQWSKKTCEAK